MTTKKPGKSRPPRLRQVWPAVEPEHQPRLGYSRDAKLRKVRDLLAWRSLRTEVLGSRLLQNPAWDALLHIYAGELANCAVTLSELASALETSTAAADRWVRVLEAEGLVDRRASSESALAAVQLTDHGIGGMHALFELLPGRGYSGALSA